MAGKVRPIPEGFHSITPHLIINGADKAIEFYKKAFGAEEICRMPGPDGKSIMHAEMKIGDSLFMIASENPQWGCKSPKTLQGTPVGIHLYVENVDASFKKAEAAGAQVAMPPMDMFWGDRYAKLIDPFGHEWSIAQHIEDVPPEQMGERAAKAMAEMGCGK